MDDLKVVLDIWNGYIKWVVFAQEEWKTVALVKEMVKTKWMRKWKILEIDDFMYSINSVLDSFTKKLWEHFFDEVYVTVSHPDLRIKRITEQKRLLNPIIDKDDVNHLLNVVNDTVWEPNYEIVYTIPVQWIIDEQIKLKDPTGMEWRKLELVADVFMLPKNFYNTIYEAFDKLWLGVVNVVPGILWSVEVALDFDSKDLWILLIDIGNNQTSYSVYEEWYPVLYGVLPIWWEDVTKDISIWLQVDIKEAENIKREKWVIFIWEEKTKDDKIDMAFLSDIIAARYEEIFDNVNKNLRLIWRDWKLPGWVVLIWGWVKVKNLDKLAKEVFKLATFYGKDRVLNVGEISSNLQFVTLLWTYVWVNKYFENKSRWFSMNMDFGFVKKITKFFKDMF